MSRHDILVTIIAPLCASLQTACYPPDNLEPWEKIPMAEIEPCAEAESLADAEQVPNYETADTLEFEDIALTDEDTLFEDDILADEELEYNDEIFFDEDYFFDKDFGASMSTVDTNCTRLRAAPPSADTLAEPALPYQFALSQNYPNPFNPATTIFLTLPAPMSWKLTIFNMLGQVVYESTGEAGPGRVEIGWDASDCASGVYIYRAVAGEYRQSRKMLLLK